MVEAKNAMTREWPDALGEQRASRARQASLVQWATACAGALELSRRTWRALRDRLPPGDGRKAFVVPAIAITGAFLAGAWWLRSRSHHEAHKGHKDHKEKPSL